MEPANNEIRTNQKECCHRSLQVKHKETRSQQKKDNKGRFYHPIFHSSLTISPFLVIFFSLFFYLHPFSPINENLLISKSSFFNPFSTDFRCTDTVEISNKPTKRKKKLATSSDYVSFSFFFNPVSFCAGTAFYSDSSPRSDFLHYTIHRSLLQKILFSLFACFIVTH